MANSPRIDIGVRVDYKEVLEQMKSSFKKELTEISNHAKKTSFDADIEKKLKQIDDKVDSTFGNFEKKFDELSNQTIKTENFEKYQKKVSKMFDDVRSSISGAVGDISKLRDEVKMLSGADFASSMKKQFEDLCQDVKKTHNELLQILDVAQSPSGDSAIVKQYSKTLDNIRKMKEEIKNINSQKNMGDGEAIEDQYFAELDNLDEYFNKYKELKKKLSALSKEDSGYSKLENDLINQEVIIKKSIATIKHLNGELEDIFGYSRLDDETSRKFKIASSFDKEIDSFAAKVEKVVSKSKEASEQIQGEFSTFRMKDGAIHIPIDIATNNEELKDKVKKIVKQLKSYVDNTPIIAKVKLTLDKSSSKGYEKNSEVDKQQSEGQNEPALDITKAIQKAYRDAAREAKQIVKTEIKKIQEEFENVPVKIKPDTDAFEKEVSAMVNGTLEKIAKESSNINVNKELEKLVGNLKEVSTSLSGNENFKLGLDEESIKSITDAIKNMADMIQRAFGVASNDDITAQWAAIESKFKGVAGEEGKLLKGNKEHKVAIQELAAEYKKYLDMGGKNDLSALTAHKQTVKNITAEYENLGKAAQEAVQQQEKAAKKPAAKKVTSEEAEAIKGITRENKKLETQAGKTGTALDNEAKSAQSAAEKFRKLAKEKGAAVVANRELAKAAKETADALTKEANARKSGAGKTTKNAIDEGVYSNNFLKWQSNIESSLKDSGNYANVYEAKISQATNGTVKFTAVVRTLDGELKKFSAGVNNAGEMFSPSVSAMGEKQAADFEKRLKVAEKNREAIAAMDGEPVEPLRLNTEELERYVDNIQKILQGLGDSGTTYKLDLTDSGKLSIVRKEISETGAETKSFTAIIDRVDDLFEETADGVVVSAEKIQAALAGAFDSGKVSKSTKDLASKAQDAFDKFKLKNEGDSNWGDITAKVKKLEDSIASIGSQDDLNKFNQDLKDLGVTLKNIGKDNKLGDILNKERTFKDISEVRANIDSLFASTGKVNEKSINIKGADKLTAEVKLANGEIRKMTVSLDSNGFARFVNTGIVQFGRLRAAAEGVFQGIKSMVRIYLSPQDFIRYFTKGFDTVKEIDTAMTELKKVSDAPIGDIVAYFDDATESAKELGSTVKDMISATADWSRLGYDLPDSRELGEVAVLYKNVGDGIDIDTANESLVSTIQGFQLQAKDAMSVIDSFNEVSNNYAISSAGIGEALKRSAAAFNAANTDLNQSIALITAGNEIVQSPEKIGTMWQTVSARIRGTKTELEELGESTDDVLSSSKLRNLVKGYTGVDILKDKNTYKDIYTIVSEIGEKWKDLTDMQRAALLEGLAGKKQSNTLAAVLNNADRLEEIYETAVGSAGSAQREQERYAQSVQYSLDQLTAHGEEFWQTFIKKDDVKNFIDLINTLISGATKLVEVFGSIPTVAGILGGFVSIKYGAGIFNTFPSDGGASKLGMFNKSFWAMKKDLASGQGLEYSLFGGQGFNKGDAQAILNFNTALKNGVAPAKAWATTMGKASISAQNATRSTLKAKGSLTNLASGLQATSVGAKAASIGLKALSVAANMLFSMGIALAINLIVEGIQNLANAQENAIAKADEFIAEFNEQRTALVDNKKAIDSMSEDYQELANGVDSLGRNVSLNADEYARYNEIVNQIADMFPQMIQGYTDEGNAIIAHKGSVEELTKAYEDQKKAAQDAIIVGSADVFKGFKAKIDKNAMAMWEESGLLQMKEFVDEIIGTGGDVKKIQDIIDSLNGDHKLIGDVFGEMGLDRGWFDGNVRSADYISQNIAKFGAFSNTLNTEIEAETAKIKPIMQAYLEQSFDFQGLDEKTQDIVKQIVGQFDSEFYAQFNNETEMASWVTENIVNKFKGKDGGKLAIEFGAMFDLQTKFNEGDITVAEYQEKLSAFLTLIENLPNDTQKSIKLLFGIKTNDDGTTSSDVDTMVANVKKKFEGKFEKEIWGLSLPELEILSNLDISPKSINDWSEVEALIANATKEVDKMTTSLSELEKVSGNIKPLGTAFKELSDNGYITIKTLSEVKAASDLSGEEWDAYETKLLNAKVGSSEFNQVMSDLTYKILDNTFATADLNSLTEEQIAATLRENGVTNANAVAHEWLTNAKQREAAQSAASALAADSLTDGLDEMANQCGLTSEAFVQLIAQEILFNKTNLTVNQQIEALDRLAQQAGITGSAIKAVLMFDSFKEAYDTATYSLEASYRAGHITKEERDRRKREILDGFVKDIFGNEVTNPETTPVYTSPSSNKDKSDKNEALDNYLKDAENRYKVHQDETRYIQDLQYAYDNLTKTDKERLDITGKINEAYRDLADNRIKDIEHQIELAKELNEYADATDYYKQIQKIAHEEANRLRAMGYDDNSNEIQELQKTWWDAQNKIADESYSKSERWINERNTYNDWDLYGDNEIAAWERVLYRFKAEFPKELETIKDIEQKIFAARKDAMEKLIDDIESYIDARNTYNDWDAYGDSEVNAIQRESKIIEVAYTNRLLSYEEYVDRLEELSQRVYSLGQERVEKHLSNLDRYINARNHYNDWDAFNDSEIEAIKRQCKILDEAYRSNLISYEEYVEKTEEYTQRLYSVAKENIIEEISKLIEDYEEKKQLESSQLDSQKTLLQSYYDVTNSIAEAQHEINKELKASMTMYEYLNEETRKLLFNQEDYEALSKELLDIQSAADALQKQYQEDILNANAETIAEITSQYQMQYETMMKQYEIAKAELEVAKKRQQLDNVLAERNTRMFINGQWQWVANTQDVINAQNELAEAEIERKKKEASLEQTEAINDFTEKINSLETDLNKVREYWSDMQEMLNGEADDVAKALKEISEVSSPELKKVIDATGGTITSFSTTLSESTTTLSDIVSGDRGLGTVSTNIGTIITDLENYSDAIQNLTNKINGVSTDNNKKGNSSSVDAIIAQMQANSIKWHVASEIEKEALHKENLQLGASIGATYDSATGKWIYPEVKSSPSSGSTSSSKGSSSGTISTTTVTNPDGSKTKVTIDASTGSTTTKGLSTGTIVHTAGGNYKIVSSGTVGAKYNPNSGYWSVKVNADGSRYTSDGLNLIGEEGFEAFISNTGRLIPISQPTLANIGAGGIIFNREQMANLRNLWDISNLGKLSPFVSSSNANSQSTLIDNSIHINGMTIGERGNEDWINGLRRYVATHK